ncbi:hypothetical protein [Natronorubrum sp. DTA7]|uniref:hypothetical protein n=1 Tax=Natronorubrum sp. DTA7 TaxID=3447016 RepID=UPI003F86CBFF
MIESKRSNDSGGKLSVPVRDERAQITRIVEREPTQIVPLLVRDSLQVRPKCCIEPPLRLGQSAVGLGDVPLADTGILPLEEVRDVLASHVVRLGREATETADLEAVTLAQFDLRPVVLTFERDDRSVARQHGVDEHRRRIEVRQRGRRRALAREQTRDSYAAVTSLARRLAYGLAREMAGAGRTLPRTVR